MKVNVLTFQMTMLYRHLCYLNLPKILGLERSGVPRQFCNVGILKYEQPWLTRADHDQKNKILLQLQILPNLPLDAKFFAGFAMKFVEKRE